MFVAAEVTPVILVLALGDQAEGEAAAQRAGHIDAAAAAAEAVGGAANAGVPVILRFFADQVDDAAGAEDAIQQRSGTFQHLDAIGGGVHAQPLVAAHAVDEHRTVGVNPKAAFNEAILGAAERVALGDAADEFHRVIDAFDLEVVNHL